MRGRRLMMMLLAGWGWTLVGCASTEPADDKDEAQASQPAARIVVPAPTPRDGLIPVGQAAPDFEAMDHTGRLLRLGDLLATQDVVLIFYPKDFTPVCTKQLCAVRDDWTDFQNRRTIVLGVNPAEASEHARFAAEHAFPFPVVSDPLARIAAGYGAKGDNPAFPKRTVYVIRKNGNVALSERGVVGHDKIFAALDRP